MTWSRTWALASVAVLHAGSAIAQGPNMTEREIHALLDESAASWNRGDLDGHLADNADSISFMTRRGEPERSGWFSTIWERQAAGWRVIHDHSS